MVWLVLICGVLTRSYYVYRNSPTFVENSLIKIEKKVSVKLDDKQGWYPDGIVSIFKTRGGDEMWSISGKGKSVVYKVEGNSLHKSVNGTFKEDKRTNTFYNAATSIIPVGDNKSDLYFATTHREKWSSVDNSSNFTASVGLGLIDGRGELLKDFGEVITGLGAEAPGKKISGAGQPSGVMVIEKGQKYLWVYYTGWFPGRSDQIYLARIRIEGEKPIASSVEYYSEWGWTADQGRSIAIFSPPNSDSNYAALPDVKKINGEMFLATFETDKGVFMTKSTDGLLWEKPQVVIKYSEPLSKVWKTGGVSQSYPSWYFDETTKRFLFFMADRVGPGSSHHLICFEGGLNIPQKIPVLAGI